MDANNINKPRNGDTYLRTKEKNGKTYAMAKYIFLKHKWKLLEKIKPPQLVG